MVERVIGYEKTKRLVDVSCDMKHRVPLANKWLAQCLYDQGLSVAAIARRLRCSDITVRKYLKGQNLPRRPHEGADGGACRPVARKPRMELRSEDRATAGRISPRRVCTTGSTNGAG